MSRRFSGLAHRIALVAGAAVGLSALPARGTWSIILIDAGSGEVAIGSATCLVGFDLQAGTPVLLTGIGGATAQSFVDSTGQNRVFIRDRLLLGVHPQTIITQLASFDSGHQTRQYGIGDTRFGGRVATFTGSSAGQFAGGQIGTLKGEGSGGADLVFAIQGNLLTNRSVIDGMFAAIAKTPGDLAGRLMAAMEAARAAGGDGRCSCLNGQAPCTPPPNFVRSSYIAYMLIARTGDLDGCNGIYRAGAGTSSVFAADVNADGRVDLVTANPIANSLSVMLNTTGVGGGGGGTGVATFAPATTLAAPLTPRDVLVLNANGDAFPDLASSSFGADIVSIYPGLPGGTFGARLDTVVGDGPLALEAFDVDGDGDVDLATANFPADTVSILTNDAGLYTLAATIPVGDGPAAIDSGDLDSDGDADLAVLMSNAGTLVILRNQTPMGGPPAFAPDPPLTVGGGGTGVAIANLDADPRLDIAVAVGNTSRVITLLQSDAGFTPTEHMVTSPSNVVVRDATGDGLPDLLAATRAGSSSRLAVLGGRGDGSFEAARTFAIGFSPTRVAASDLNGDGDLDAAVALNGSVMTIESYAPGQFNDGVGCATGDYFMEFNITTNDPNAPDPVGILATQFAQWRTQLEGRPDAVRSTRALSRTSMRADGSSTASLTFTLLDWRGLPVTAPLASVEVLHAPGSDGICGIGAATPGPGGSYTATITAGTQVGSDRFHIRADDGIRPVILMPDSALTITVNTDWNGDGVVTSDDFFAFLEDFLAGTADANTDGITNSQDFFDFLTIFFGG
jgi:hypothetical protein